MKRATILPLASLLLTGALAVSGSAMASNIAPDHGLDVGHQVPPLNPVAETHDAGINLGDGTSVVNSEHALAPASGIEAKQYRRHDSGPAAHRTAYNVDPLVSDGGV